MRALRLLVLIVLVGIPLWIKGLITGKQEGWLMDFYERILGE